MNTQWTIVDDAGAAALAAKGWATYADFADRQPGKEVGRGGTTRTTQLMLPDDGGSASDSSPAYFIKVYRYAGRQWRHRFRTDKATIEANNYVVLRDEVGVGCPEVVAFGARRGGLRLLDAVIVTRAMDGVIDLQRLFEGRWPHVRASLQDRIRRAVLDAVAATVRRMHERGFRHIDLQWRNILIGEPDAARPRVYLIDAPRGGCFRDTGRLTSGQLRDLSCLYKEARRRLTRGEQLRYLLAILGESTVTDRVRQWMYAVLRDRSIKDNDGRVP